MKYALYPTSVLLLAVGLSGCSGSGDSTTNSPSPVTTPTTTTSQSTSPTNTGQSANIRQPTSPANFILGSAQPSNSRYAVTRPTSEQAAQIQKAVENTNKLRAEKGLPALKYDETLAVYAQLRANEVVRTFSHTRPNGQKFNSEITIIGAGSIGENIAGGNATADETVLEQWRDSADHYKNMTSDKYTSIGIGLVYVPNSTYEYYWVQIFGRGNIQTPYYFGTTQTQSHNPRPLDTLTINGRTITLPTTPMGNWLAFSDGQHQGWVNGYQNTRFGAVNSANGSQVFYQGMQTAIQAIPTGRADYHGKAIIVKDKGFNTNATAEFTVDFGRQTLSGSIKENNKTLFNLSGDINGNTFQSKATANVEMQGAFFGSAGEELAGAFKDKTSNAQGAFGAVKK